MPHPRFVHGECEILWREQATLAAVLMHLRTVTHFLASTHGRPNPMQPRQSQLHLADAPAATGHAARDKA